MQIAHGILPFLFAKKSLPKMKEVNMMAIISSILSFIFGCGIVGLLIIIGLICVVVGVVKLFRMIWNAIFGKKSEKEEK